MKRALIVLAGCGRIGFGAAHDGGATGDATGDAGAGVTRLKHMWEQFDDGARAPAGIFDSVRGESCEILGLTDGHTYCLPGNFTIADYSDASCTQPVAVLSPSGCAAPGYAIDRDACGGLRAELPLAGAVGLASVYLGGAGTCSGPAPIGTSSPFALGPPLTMADLAQIELAPPVGSGRIQSRSYTTQDGFTQPAVAYDQLLAADCQPITNPSGSSCEPTDLSYTTLALDSQCLQPLAAGIPSCAAPRFGSYDVSGTCGHHYGLVTSPVSPQPTTIYYSGSCQQATSPGGLEYYNLGAAVSVVALTRAPVAEAGHRIWPIALTSTDFSVHDTALYDSALGVECGIGYAGDGSLRCIPVGASVAHAFSDAGCTVAIDVTITLPPAVGSTCASQPPAYAIEYMPSACGLFEHVWRAGATYAGPLYTGSPISCVTLGPTTPVFVITEVAPTELAAATLVTDP